MTPEGDNCVFVLVNLDPHNRQECTYEVPLWVFGLPDDGAVEVEDLLQRLPVRAARQDPTASRSIRPSAPCVIWRLGPPRRGCGAEPTRVTSRPRRRPGVGADPADRCAARRPIAPSAGPDAALDLDDEATTR